MQRLLRTVRDSVRDAWLAGAELGARDWATALAYAAVKWAADLMCLVAVVAAFDQPVGVVTLTGVYLGVQMVRQVPLTPGGVGVVETALAAGLTAAGANGISAAATVLIYRLLSCWLIVPAGGVAAFTLRTGRRPIRPGRLVPSVPGPGQPTPAPECAADGESSTESGAGARRELRRSPPPSLR